MAKLINADTAPPPQKWGVDEMMRCLLILLAATEGGKFAIRKDLFKQVTMNHLHAVGIKDCGQFYLLHLAKEAHGGIIIPAGGIWSPT